MMGRRSLYRPEVTATLDADVSGPEEKLQFARVLLRRGPRGYRASPTGPPSSNLLSTVARANGLAMIPPGVQTARAGDEVRVMVLRSLEG
jgi:molybdopterin molybdotransferase